ncbi:alpha-galactosidase [Dactylosporangium matsuzakiense]|uniref:Alpha-galactosidase n=1 Tax=Dactylosporangium matsuzakiense TaxID=53360 RepID=A0A9W6KQ60_9ACTN|nr:alpha-galactosidase [Dactylosporangium matsuzakiense]UWZ47494.1 alpha-galactosidase [Dactylosporangium matsuzakiense]GLL05253.1 alpha-galactosidase [Dactylosporangium matsuzakiense]
MPPTQPDQPGTVSEPTPNVWVLRTPGSAYVLSLGGEDVPLTAHWGAPVDDEAAVALAKVPLDPSRGSWESRLDGREEYPSDTGLRFTEPALALRFPDDSRTVRWMFTGSEVVEGHLRLRYRELTRPVRLTLHYRVCAHHDVVERWAALETDVPVEVVRADSAAWCLPPCEQPRLSTLHGRWGADSRLERTALPHGTVRLGSRRTTTSPMHNPWLAVDDGTATEAHGEVWTAALAWSGTWRIDVQRLPNGRVVANLGAGHEAPVARLSAGDTWETPKSCGLWSGGGFGAASRAWHDFTLSAVLPHADELRPVLYNSWEATGFMLDEANQMALAEQAAALGCELFVMDDGWFGRRVSDNAGLGDWLPNSARFPDGLGPLIARVHQLGMRFGIWVEPEMVNPDSDLYRAHPDWVYASVGYPRHELRNQLVLNLGMPEVAAWLHEWLDRLLSDNDIAFVKWDMNRPVTDPGPYGDRLWSVRHTVALYGILDRLRRDHPAVRFESCASGGGRVDLGILARTDQVWTSDNTDASDRLHIQEGFSQLYPARAMTAWVTDTPNFLTGNGLPLRFRFHVAMAGVLGVGGDLPQWTDEERALAAELIGQYKRVRPIVQHGRLYRLRSPRESTAPALAYLSETGDEAAVFQFLDGHRYGEPAPPARLPFLPAGTWEDADTGTRYPAGLLATHGLDAGLFRNHDSAVTHLRRLA